MSELVANHVPDPERNPDDVLFTTERGRPRDPSAIGELLRMFRREFEPELSAIGIDAEHLTFRSLRKAVAAAVSDTVGVEVARDLLGHSDIAITEGHYAKRPELIGLVAVGGVVGAAPRWGVRGQEMGRGLPEDGSSHAANPEDLDVLDATFAAPDLSSFAGLDGLGLCAVGQRIEADRAVIACRVVADDDWCRRCGCRGVPRDSVVRRLAHAPLGWRPTTLHVVLRRYVCSGCGHIWRQDTTAAAAERAKLTKTALRWALEALVVHKLTVARVADALDVAWHTANDAVIGEGKRVLIDDPTRFDGVRVLGVDEHVWRHTRRGDKYVTVIIDLTPVRDRTGTARLLDMVEGRSKQVFKDWLAARPESWRKHVEVVAMDGFSGFKTAAAEEIPKATAVMDPFHVVRLAADALDRCRRRVQQQLHGHRGRAGDPLYTARRTLSTGDDLLTEKQRARLTALFAEDEHVEVEATWGIYSG